MTNGLFYMSSTLCYISTRTLKRYSLDYANSVFPFLSSSTNSLSTVFISSTSFFFLIFVLFIFGCTGSSLLHAGFSSAVSGGYSCLGCSSFLSRWLLLVQSTGSRHSGFSSSGSQPQLLHSMWTLPGTGIEPMFPAFTRRFSSTAPPGKSKTPYFFNLLKVSVPSLPYC